MSTKQSGTPDSTNTITKDIIEQLISKVREINCRRDGVKEREALKRKKTEEKKYRIIVKHLILIKIIESDEIFEINNKESEEYGKNHHLPIKRNIDVNYCNIALDVCASLKRNNFIKDFDCFWSKF